MLRQCLLTCIAVSNGLSDVWTENCKVKMTWLQNNKNTSNNQYCITVSLLQIHWPVY